VTAVRHVGRNPKDRGPKPDLVERIDSRLISLARGQVYLVPEGRLIREEDAKAELQRHKFDNGHMMRS